MTKVTSLWRPESLVKRHHVSLVLKHPSPFLAFLYRYLLRNGDQHLYNALDTDIHLIPDVEEPDDILAWGASEVLQLLPAGESGLKPVLGDEILEEFDAFEVKTQLATGVLGPYRRL